MNTQHRPSIATLLLQRLLRAIGARRPIDTDSVPGLEVMESNWGEWEAAGGEPIKPTSENRGA